MGASREEVEAIRARLADLSAPWAVRRVDPSSGTIDYYVVDSEERIVCKVNEADYDNLNRQRRMPYFLAHAPDDLALLLAEVDALREEVRVTRELCVLHARALDVMERDRDAAREETARYKQAVTDVMHDSMADVLARPHGIAAERDAARAERDALQERLDRVCRELAGWDHSEDCARAEHVDGCGWDDHTSAERVWSCVDGLTHEQCDAVECECSLDRARALVAGDEPAARAVERATGVKT